MILRTLGASSLTCTLLAAGIWSLAIATRPLQWPACLEAILRPRASLAKAAAEGVYRREGANAPRPLSGRLIATIDTGSDASLFGSTPHHTIRIAPLAERTEDVLPLAAHYLAIGLLIVGIGTLAGCLVGMRLGEGLTGIYAHYLRLPDYTYEMAPRIVLAAAAISVAAASLGSLGAVRRAVALPPAEAMRPEPPARFRTTRLESLGLDGQERDVPYMQDGLPGRHGQKD